VGTRVSLGAAFERLLEAYDPPVAARKLEDALLDGRARLYCNGRCLGSGYVAAQVRVVAELFDPRDPDSPIDITEPTSATQWRCVVRPKGPVGWESLVYAWEVEGVEGLWPKRSRGQEHILAVAAELWPNGQGHIENRQIIKDVSDALKRRRQPVPGRDVFLRALRRRKG
jgi:hypothetical protein